MNTDKENCSTKLSFINRCKKLTDSIGHNWPTLSSLKLIRTCVIFDRDEDSYKELCYKIVFCQKMLKITGYYRSQLTHTIMSKIKLNMCNIQEEWKLIRRNVS